MINRTFFFDQVSSRLFGGKLSSKPKETLGKIIDYWEENFPKGDDRWLAYALGTAHHETDRKFGPIREYGLGQGKKYAPYYGPWIGSTNLELQLRKNGKEAGN
jgi:putative chitinase